MLHEIFKGMDNAAEQIDENFKQLDVEVGEDENGRWYKFPSGLAICTKEVVKNITALETYGSLYRSRENEEWYFPIKFEKSLYLDVRSNHAFPLTYVSGWNENGESLSYRPTAPTRRENSEGRFLLIAVGYTKESEVEE